MGFLASLFGSDPRKDLEKAQGFLDGGRPDRAIELARKAAGSDQANISEAAEKLIQEARGRLIDNALEMATGSEESEYWEDAVEWLDRALEQIDDPQRAAEVKARKEALIDRIEAAEEEAWQKPEPQEAEPDEPEIDLEDSFVALVDMMDDEIGRQYMAQDDEFRSAYLALYDGRPAEALPVFDSLMDDRSNDPVLRFERGRARLFSEDFAGAREDLEVAWQEWGDIFLDRAGTLSVASVWSEALLGLGEPEPILERLESAARPANGQPELSFPYAQALILAQQYEEAEKFLSAAVGRFPSSPDFGLLLASMLESRDRRQEAIHCLEISVAPSCASGTCGKPPKHVPSLRTLATLLLASESDEEGEKARKARLERVSEVLGFVREALGGGVAKPDALMWVEHARQAGDEKAVAEWTEMAEQMENVGAERERVALQTPKVSAETPL